MRATRACLAGAALLSAIVACLPADDRPPPGRIFVTAEPSDATKNGFVTADGWAITFDRFVTALGDIDLDGPGGQNDTACSDYSETHYEWLYDFTVVEREKVGVVYAIGECSVEWRLRGPSDETQLGSGVTEGDVRYMMTEDTDGWAQDERASVVVRGAATKDGVEKTFAWVFRRSYEVDKCPGLDGGFASVFDVEEEEQIELPLVVHGEELFRSEPKDDAPILFEPFAGADIAPPDGAITLVELTSVQTPGIVPPEGSPAAPTLADLVYSLALPRITRVKGGGACEYELRDRR